MARPKTVDYSRPPVMSKDEINSAWDALDRRISATVNEIMAATGVSQSALGRALGCTQANLSHILSRNPSSHWSVPLLIALARYFGTTVGEIITISESEGFPENSIELRVFIASCGTAPRTPERLDKLIREAVKMQMEDAGHEFREEDRASLGCRVGDVALSAPSFYSDYVRGEINDPDAFSLLSASARSMLAHGGFSGFPFWAAIRDQTMP